MTTALRGITWEHARGYGSVVAAADAYRSVRPDVEVAWEFRSLQAFADHPLERLVEQYDLLVIDHPHIPLAAEAGLLAALDGTGHDDELATLATQSVGGRSRATRTRAASGVSRPMPRRRFRPTAPTSSRNRPATGPPFSSLHAREGCCGPENPSTPSPASSRCRRALALIR
jgi:hypothetical protein